MLIRLISNRMQNSPGRCPGLSISPYLLCPFWMIDKRVPIPLILFINDLIPPSFTVIDGI
jgi:hypothetical protein